MYDNMVLLNVVEKNFYDEKNNYDNLIIYINEEYLNSDVSNTLYIDEDDKSDSDDILDNLQMIYISPYKNIKLILTRGNIELGDKHACYDFLHTPRTIIKDGDQFTRFYMLLKSKYINYYNLTSKIDGYGLINTKGIHYDHYYNLFIDKNDNKDDNYNDFNLNVNFHNELYLKQKTLPFNYLNSNYYNMLKTNIKVDDHNARGDIYIYDYNADDENIKYVYKPPLSINVDYVVINDISHGINLGSGSQQYKVIDVSYNTCTLIDADNTNYKWHLTSYEVRYLKINDEIKIYMIDDNDVTKIYWEKVESVDRTFSYNQLVNDFAEEEYKVTGISNTPYFYTITDQYNNEYRMETKYDYNKVKLYIGDKLKFKPPYSQSFKTFNYTRKPERLDGILDGLAVITEITKKYTITDISVDNNAYNETFGWLVENTIQFGSNHNLNTGDFIKIRTVDYTGKEQVYYYYCVNESNDKIKLAETYEKSIAGETLALTKFLSLDMYVTRIPPITLTVKDISDNNCTLDCNFISTNLSALITSINIVDFNIAITTELLNALLNAPLYFTGIKMLPDETFHILFTCHVMDSYYYGSAIWVPETNTYSVVLPNAAGSGKREGYIIKHSRQDNNFQFRLCVALNNIGLINDDMIDIYYKEEGVIYWEKTGRKIIIDDNNNTTRGCVIYFVSASLGNFGYLSDVNGNTCSINFNNKTYYNVPIDVSHGPEIRNGRRIRIKYDFGLTGLNTITWTLCDSGNIKTEITGSYTAGSSTKIQCYKDTSIVYDSSVENGDVYISSLIDNDTYKFNILQTTDSKTTNVNYGSDISTNLGKYYIAYRCLYKDKYIDKNSLFYNINVELPFLQNKTFIGRGTEKNPYLFPNKNFSIL